MNKHNIKVLLRGIFAGLLSLWIPMLTIAPYVDTKGDPFYVAFPLCITTLVIIILGIAFSVAYIFNNWKN